MVVASVGTVFAAGYLLWMFQRTAFGVPKLEFEHAHIHDVHVPEWLAWVPMLLLIVALGVYPHLLFRMTDGAARAATPVPSQALGHLGWRPPPPCRPLPVPAWLPPLPA